MLVLALISYGHGAAPSNPSPTPAPAPLPMRKDLLKCNLEMPQPHHCAHHLSTLVHLSSPWGQQPWPEPYARLPSLCQPTGGCGIPVSAQHQGTTALELGVFSQEPDPRGCCSGLSGTKKEKFQHPAKPCLTIE